MTVNIKNNDSSKKINNKTGIRMTFVSSDAKRLDQAILTCCEKIRETGGTYFSLVRMPNKQKYLLSLNRSPHVYKGAQDQYKQSRYKAILYVKTSPHTLSALSKLVICAGVDVIIKKFQSEGGV